VVRAWLGRPTVLGGFDFGLILDVLAMGCSSGTVGFDNQTCRRFTLTGRRQPIFFFLFFFFFFLEQSFVGWS